MKLTQTSYINELVLRFNMGNSKPISTPLPPGTVLTKDMSPATQEEREENSKRPYKELIGGLLYLVSCTRPDIAHAVGMLARYMDNPGTQHWEAAKHVLRYLKGTSDLGITYTRGKYQGSSTSPLVGYSDSDYAGCLDTRKSTTGYVFFVNQGPVSWSSTLQPVVTTSSTYAEYVALSTTTQECMFLREILRDMQVAQVSPTVIMADNQGSMFLAENRAFTKRSKHIEVRFHYVRECIENKKLELQYCPTDKMLADMFTKQLPATIFIPHRNRVLGSAQ